MGRKRSGRRPGRPDTRQQILAAAREIFAAEGYERSSIRRIATAAEVDPALIHHYFGTKDKLFLEAVEAPFDPKTVIPEVFGPGITDVGERLVRAFIGVWDSPNGTRAEAFLRSAVNHPFMSKLVEQFILNHIIKTALNNLDAEIDHVSVRGSLIASQLLGLAVARYLVKLSAIRDLSPDTLAKIYGPTIQRYLEMDLTDLHLPPSD
ncbi:TetR family transcriptional regulator [Stackebrandtia endophytica]|uniref:TetR family transcriptional regulator n=1 Tax=Stackebrandtia endophytica TaxID=1496996 RepID=A0A543AQJ6_9ACTN|nr:TetR family transcriptional regulator [Stackebrandtia endophytica]TQL74834.1 TetR family transcriptional regulator [Stackebrandtia endophytica]